MCDTYAPDQRLSETLKKSEILMNCIGNDINRQIITVLSSAGQNGMRVPEITAKTFLSRPSVTSHLKELQKAGLVSVHHAGTKITTIFTFLMIPFTSWKNCLKAWLTAIICKKIKFRM